MAGPGSRVLYGNGDESVSPQPHVLRVEFGLDPRGIRSLQAAEGLIRHGFQAVFRVCGPVYVAGSGKVESGCCRLLVTGGPASPHTPLLCHSWLSRVPLPLSQRGSRWRGSRGVCHANLSGSYPHSPSPTAYASSEPLGSYFRPEGGRMLGVPGWGAREARVVRVWLRPALSLSKAAMPTVTH